MKVQRRVNIPPKIFKLVRIEDESGISGVGDVAYGVMFDIEIPQPILIEVNE